MAIRLGIGIGIGINGTQRVLYAREIEFGSESRTSVSVRHRAKVVLLGQTDPLGRFLLGIVGTMGKN